MQYLTNSTTCLLALTVSIGMFCVPAALADSSVVPTQSYATQSSGALDTRSSSATRRLTALRNSFVLQTKIAGFTCHIAPPKIVLTDKSSFGSYEPETNILQTPTWQQLSADERAVFIQMAGPGAGNEAAQAAFEQGIHHWVFIHEMGHWWQACTQANHNRMPYQVEYDADRIAAAYWRHSDPTLAAKFATGFQRFVDAVPSPVPAGQTPESYFNENYEKLTGTPGYTWFQAQMIVTANSEKPVPTFAQTLNERQ
jgi:hypothetical protein